MFGVLHRCSRVCHASRYFVTSCLYDFSLYHNLVLCLHACGSLGTSPSGDESGFCLTNVVQYSSFLSATFAMTSEDQDDIHFVQDPSIPFHAAIHWFSSSVIIYTLLPTSLFIPGMPVTCVYCVIATFRAVLSFRECGKSSLCRSSTAVRAPSGITSVTHFWVPVRYINSLI